MPLTERFSSYFSEKIKKLVTDLQQTSKLPTASPDITFRTSHETLDDFLPVTEDQVVRLIAKSKASTCSHDPVPTSLVKLCAKEHAPIFTRIINLSLENGFFPDPLKHCHIRPILKNPKLNTEELNSYRPIANLKFLGKMIERVVALQIKDHISHHFLYATTQSAYRAHHSCETALLRVYNDLLLALDVGQEAILVLLDY